MPSVSDGRTQGAESLHARQRGNGGCALIGGFIVTGTENIKVALRVLGPSLSDAGVADTLADPILTLHDFDRHGHRNE